MRLKKRPHVKHRAKTLSKYLHGCTWLLQLLLPIPSTTIGNFIICRETPGTMLAAPTCHGLNIFHQRRQSSKRKRMVIRYGKVEKRSYMRQTRVTRRVNSIPCTMQAILFGEVRGEKSFTVSKVMLSWNGIRSSEASRKMYSNAISL